LRSASGAHVAFASPKARISLSVSHAAVVAADDLVGPIGRRVGRDHELELVGGVVELQQVSDARVDHVLLVVRRHDQADGRLDVGLAYGLRAHTPQRGGGDRIADVVPCKPTEACPEDRLHDHGATVPIASAR
jgi:hypothetical protein